MGFLRTLCLTLLCAFLCALLCVDLPRASAYAEDGHQMTAEADQLRALFVQRLIKYVTWPSTEKSGHDTPIIVAATDARSLRPYFPQSPDSPFQLVQWPADHCQVLVLNGITERTAAAILKRVAKNPILTVGQFPTGPRMGLVVNFMPVEGKLKLEINPQAAHQAGLTISSKLLKLAHIYREVANE